ncbi:MAG: flagellin, partial [Endozoicomonas sp.]
MEEMTSSLLRMRDLAVQASNGTYGTADLSALDAEFQALEAEIQRIVDTTEFNGELLLDATGGQANDGNFSIAVDYKNGSTNNVTIALTVDMGADTTGAGTSTAVLNAASAAAAIGLVDTALQNVDTARAGLGAIQNRLTSTINNLSNVRENLSASRSRVMDTDFAAETANLSKFQVMQQAGTAVLAQANAVPQNVLSLLR